VPSRSIDDLTPRTADKCRKFVSDCLDAGIGVIITSTYRSQDEQDVLYAQGRTKPGARVTNAKASYHTFRCAFDFVPVVNGKAVWNDAELWERCGAIAEKVGLEWGGRWKKFPDKPHCQDTGGLTIAQLKAWERS
jgi:peptidoglycan LD-endopeptidase CwlK